MSAQPLSWCWRLRRRSGCVACWLLSQSTVDNAPIADGQPATVSVMFYAPTLALAFILLTLAGVLAVVGIARWRSSAPR